jgi:hypothetical protein
VQPPVPEHAPPQPAKLEPAAGVAVSVTVAPLSNEAEHVEPHSIPAGLLTTVPEPDPLFVTESVGRCPGKEALTDLSASIVTVQTPVPEQAPPQPAKVEPGLGVALNVTVVPLEKKAEHVAPQAIPGGLLVTVPPPIRVTVNRRRISD